MALSITLSTTLGDVEQVAVYTHRKERYGSKRNMFLFQIGLRRSSAIAWMDPVPANALAKVFSKYFG